MYIDTHMSMHFIELVCTNKYWINNSAQTSVFTHRDRLSTCSITNWNAAKSIQTKFTYWRNESELWSGVYSLRRALLAQPQLPSLPAVLSKAEGPNYPRQVWAEGWWQAWTGCWPLSYLRFEGRHLISGLSALNLYTCMHTWGLFKK